MALEVAAAAPLLPSRSPWSRPRSFGSGTRTRCPVSQATEAMLLRKSIRSLPNGLGAVLRTMEERRVPHAKIFSSLLPQMLQIDPSERITVR